MQTRKLHQICAYLALIFICWPCFRPIEASLSFGDVFLLLAATMNLQHFGKLKPFHVLLLASVPTIILTQVFDPDGSPEAVIQAAYIFGFVLPFGWIAFVGIPVHRVVTVLLMSEGVSSLVALGQTFGFLEAFGRARVWGTMDAYRAAGFNTSCSGLCMNLTSMFCLLLYVREQRIRVVMLSLLLIGLVATMAKSTIFAIPAIMFYLYWEPNRWKVMARFGGLAAVLGLVVFFSPALQLKIENVIASVTRRADGLDFSMYERLSTVRFALGYVPECYFVGLGYEGTAMTLTQHLGNTVHVFHIGIVLIGGLVGAVLHYAGYGVMLRDAVKLKHYPLVVMVFSHWLSVCTMPVLMLSNQYIPLILCATILFAASEQAELNEMQAAIEAKRRHAAAQKPRKVATPASLTTPARAMS